MAHPKMLTIILNERPKEDIVPSTTFKEAVVDRPTPADIKDGEVLFQPVYLSLDPASRGWLNDRRSYLPPVQIGEVMRGLAAGRIIASKNPQFNPGDWASGYSGWQELAALGPASVFPAKIYPGTKVTDLLGVLSSTGLTAYFGLKYIGNPKPGELVVVSGAAGATGSIVGQICKMKGARVVGIAGSDDKCKWLVDELGFDNALNYKAPDFIEKFKEATKDFIDVYWDNVGGEILDLALLQAKKKARFVECGNISTYNKSGPGIFHNLSRIVTMRIRMEGFIVFDYVQEYPAAIEELAKWLTQGHIKTRSTVVPGGLKAAPQALYDLFQGANTGKMMVEIESPTAYEEAQGVEGVDKSQEGT